MNKVNLIEVLQEETRLTKIKAMKVVDLFLMKWSKHMQMVTGLKSVDCVHFTSKN